MPVMRNRYWECSPTAERWRRTTWPPAESPRAGGVPVTGSVGLLVLGVERGAIASETADDWLDGWREHRGYYAPVESVKELLDDEQ